MAQQRAIAKCYWRWRHLLRHENAGRNGMLIAMVSRKFPNVSRSSIYKYADLWRDVFEGGQTLKGVNRYG